MKAMTVYALLKKQISSVASGISDIEAEGSNLIFTLNDGSTITVDIPAPPGADVTDIEIDANNHLIFTFSDGDVKDAGEIPLDPRTDNIVPEEFVPLKSYRKGNMIMHDNKMYICNSVTPIAGTWDAISGAFDEVDISSAISTKISNVVPSGASGGMEPSSDAGKVMTWGEYGGWEVQEIPKELPVPGIADNGKIPTVVAGQYQLQTPSRGVEAVELTQAQYNELTPAEKMNGKLYFITDAINFDNGGTSSNILIPEDIANVVDSNSISAVGEVID